MQITRCFAVTYLILIFTLTSEAGPRCPYQYRTLSDRLCYKLGLNKVVWTDANRACSRDGGRLAIIKSQGDLDNMRQMVNNLRGSVGPTYIGLIDPGDGSGFANSDKSSILNAFWEGGRSPVPQQFGDPRCAFVNLPGEGKWKSGPCGIRQQYICTFVPYDVREQNAERKRIRCHVCSNARTNEECNAQGIRLCAPNAGSCQNEVRVANGRKRIFKRCKQARACENNYIQNKNRATWLEAQCKPGNTGSSVCRCCCQGNGCNAFELPCLAKGCKPLKVPKDGEVECTDDYMIGSLCTFSCDIGFSISGSEAARCTGEEGRWTSPVPKCIRTRCFPVKEAPVEGAVTCSDENYGSSLCRFSCKFGFYLRGLSVSTCLASGKWSVDTPTCERIVCSPIEAPVNGRFLVQNPPNFGSITTFACDDKHFLAGSPSVRCTDRDQNGIGDWTAKPPNCKLITCRPPLKAPSGGKLVMSTENNEIGTVGSFQCNEGYFLRGDVTVTCEGPTTDGFGRWSQSPPKCEVIKCPELKTPENGREVRSTSSVLRYGTILTFSCKFGYFLTGSEKSQCGDKDGDGEGEWTEPPPTCKQILCLPNLKSPARGRFIKNAGSTLASENEFACSEGYFMIGKSTVTCNDVNDDGVGEWSDDVPTCQKIECLPMMDPPNNGDMLCTEENEFGTTCLFLCNFGFFRLGPENTICDDEDGDGRGEWSQPQPTCIQILCENSLMAPENGGVECSDINFYDSRCEFTCNEGFWMIGEDVSACENDGRTSDGKWSNEPPTCSVITCDNSQTPPDFGDVSCNNTQIYGSVCEYSCNVGFHLVGRVSATCRDVNNDGLGEWNSKQAKCKQSTCGKKFETLKFGKVTCSDTNSYGSVCSFQCEPGYEMIGNSSISCGEPRVEIRATWSVEGPTCKTRLCDEVTGPPDGDVICNDGNALGSECTFSCDGDEFYLRGDKKRKCVATSETAGSGVKWNKPAPSCELITCPDIKLTSEQVIVKCTADDLRYGTICAFDCEEGYALNGAGETECAEPTLENKGIWSKPSPTCTRIACTPPSFHPVNGTVECKERNLFQSVCEYKCEVGYDIVGSATRKCQADGSWDHLEPICEGMKCTPSFTAPDNGITTCTEENFFGSICQFYCDIGYELIGKEQSRCGLNRKGRPAFDQPQSTCKAIYCQLISGPVNGGRIVCGVEQGAVESNRYGTTCYLSCSDGWKVVGNPRTTCLGMGEWDETLGKCQKIQCKPPLEKPPRGQITCSDEDNMPGTACTFKCSGRLELLGDDVITCSEEGVWIGKLPTCVTP